MTDPGFRIELAFTGQSCDSPERAFTFYRSDDMIGDSGRIIVSRIGSDAQREVSYAELSASKSRDVLWEGVPVARVRRERDGRIVGEWLRPAAPVPAPIPPRASRALPDGEPPTAGMSPEAILRAFFELFGWAYQVRLGPDQQRDIKDQLRSGWTNADETERELVEYVIKLHRMLTAVPEPARDPLRAMLVETFRAEFARPSATDRSRVLAAVHQAIEALRPGATGVTPTTAGPPGPDSWLQLRPAPGSNAAGTPPRGRAPQPASASPEAAGGEHDGDGELDVEAIQRREMREARMELLRSNIAKVQGEMAKTMARW